MQIAYDKMHGCGNDYIFINELNTPMEIDKRTLVIKMSHRNYGVGADGVIFVKRSNVADFEMEMYNADGSRGEMCGNGIRCLAKYVADMGEIQGDDMTVSSFSTVYPIKVERDNSGKVCTAEVIFPIPTPCFEEMEQCLDICDKEYILSCVSVGNPHAVLLGEKIRSTPVDRIGPRIENHSIFKNRTNVEFVEVTDKEHINIRVWERGSGETLACGSGSIAAAWICMCKGLTGHEVSVTLRGGELRVKYLPDNNCIVLEGPTVLICSGIYEYTDE